MNREVDNNKILGEVTSMCKELNLSGKITRLAVNISQGALMDESIRKSRIQAKSIYVAAIYLAARREKSGLNQYGLSYRFSISPMTIRKVYQRIAKLKYEK